MDREKQRKILKWMLGQAFRADRHKKQLEERLKRIRAEMAAPYGAVKYDGMPRSQGVGDGAAALVLKEAEIEERITDQIKNVMTAKMRVMDIIECIPMGGATRQIVELRHIDMFKWREIEKAIPMSRQQCSRLYNMAIDSLLQRPTIERKVNLAESEYDAWVSWVTSPKK